MTIFLWMTFGFFLVFVMCLGYGRHQEIVDNWEQYRTNPLYMFTAFLYKPDKFPRSRWQFARQTFNEVLKEYIAGSLRLSMGPIALIFEVMGGGLGQSVGGVGKIQGIMALMFEQFGKITEVFERRFESVLHRFAMTFRKLQTTLARMWGIAASTMYQSLAVVSSILSTLDLIMKIVIIILVILVAIVIFLFLFLWPVIPVILGVIGIITAAGMGGAVGGMASTFCFTGDTQVILADGSTQSIASIAVGAKIRGGDVLGVLHFQQMSEDLYELYGVHVSGSHIIYNTDGNPCFVKDHPDARRLPTQTVPLYCLLTSHQRIPILSERGVLEFADWEEIGEEDQLEWNRFVFESLNPGVVWDRQRADVEGEAAFHPSTRVQCADGWRPISAIHPGMFVLDAGGSLTEVVGHVVVDAPHVGSHWQQRDGIWQQVRIPVVPHTLEYHTLLTKAGTFMLETGAVRDFSDVGMSELPETYAWVLKTLGE